MLRILIFSVAALLTATPALAGSGKPDHPPASGCDARPRPLLSVADFDGDGVVDRHDLAHLRRAIHEGQYYAMYDRNADRKLDRRDLAAAAHDLRKHSTAFDKELVAAFNRFRQFQTITSPQQLLQLGFQPGTQALQGHGVHWLSNDGVASTQGLKPADVNNAEGVNVPTVGDSVWAMFWGDPAQPLFEDPSAPSGLSALDYPAPGGAWETRPVQAFATLPRKFFSSHEENWHPHAGLCAVGTLTPQGPQIAVHQYTTFAACQAMPSDFPSGIVHRNAWMNFWMMHLWLFNLNPNGPFGETHPCLDPDAMPEHMINGDRPVPPFFQMHGMH